MNELNPKQLQAIVMLVEGKSQKMVAELLEVAPQTVTEWKKQPEFEIVFNEAKLEIITSGREAIRASVGMAIKSLKILAEHADNLETRRRASIDILTIAGIADPNDGRWTWGIGPTNEAQSKYNPEFSMLWEKPLDKFN